MCSLIPSLMYSRGDALKYPLHCCHQVSQFAPVSGLRSTPSIAARHRRAGSARRRRLWRDIGAERRAPASELSSTPSMAARHGRRAPASGLSSTQSLAARHRRGAPCAGQRDLSGLSSTPSMTARRRRRAPCAGGGRLSSTPSMAARRRRGAPCAGERAQFDAVDCGAALCKVRRSPASGLSSTRKADDCK